MEDTLKTEPLTQTEVYNWCQGTLGTDFTLERLTDILNGDYDLKDAREDILSFR